MDECPACANAREHPNSGIFQVRCDGCSARSLARTPAFHAAAKANTLTPAYRMALSQFFPSLTTAEAHLRVKEWVTPKTG